MGWILLAQAAEVQKHMQSSWTLTGLLIILIAIYLGDKILEHLKSRGVDLHVLVRQVKELHDWHNHDDPEQPGVKIWWNQKYLADIVKELSRIQTKQTDLLRELHREQQRMREVQEKQLKLLDDLISSQAELMRRMGVD